MNPATSRGRLIFMSIVAVLILERLVITGLALTNFGQPFFNWISVILPLTHIAVVLFLVYTSDMLIYWLVIMWEIITTGNFAYMLWEKWTKANATHRTDLLGDFLPKWWPLAALVIFHLGITVLFLMPVVRGFLAQQRSKLDFEDAPPAPSPQTHDESQKM